MIKYSPIIEKSMKAHYDSLNQKDRRHYAGIEAMKLGHGGNKYIAEVLDCNVQTIMQGIKEIKNPEPLLEGRIRRPGGGDRKRIEKNEKIIEVFEKVIAEKTAGSPVNPDIVWTNLKPSQIVESMRKEGVEVSVYIVDQIFEIKGMRKRGLHKGKTLKSVEGRDEQFQNLKKIKEEAEIKGNPVISTDTKKKKI